MLRHNNLEEEGPKTNLEIHFHDADEPLEKALDAFDVHLRGELR